MAQNDGAAQHFHLAYADYASAHVYAHFPYSYGTMWKWSPPFVRAAQKQLVERD